MSFCLSLSFAACLKDIQSFFRHDDPEHRPAFFAVSKYNLARSDLVPLIVTYPEDYEVIYNARKFYKIASGGSMRSVERQPHLAYSTFISLSRAHCPPSRFAITQSKCVLC